eukprot:11681285-Ditylum_brightwellii.AAC.1
MSSTVGGKVAQGKTGIKFRLYKFPEFKKLTPEQKKELKEWHQKNKPKNKGGENKNSGQSNANKRQKKLISSINLCFDKLEEALINQLTAEDDDG